MRSVNIRLIKNTQDEGDKIMYEIMSADEAIRLIRDGDCICVNSFVGIENPTELHEAIYRRYQKMQSPTHLTIVSSAGFGVWDEEHNAERYIKECKQDMEALNIKPATHQPRATEEIGGMIKMIQTLIEKGHAYEVDGTVYFKTRSFKDYGKLSN